MKILVACEESQRVTIELRNLGVEAYSCDLLSSSGNHPEWHIKGDCLPQLIPTNIVEPDIVTYIKGDGSVTTFSKDYVSIPKGVDRATFRSKTFPGIAKAIATQYYKYLSEL